ncbi:MAG: protease Do, partial [Dyella sp.]
MSRSSVRLLACSVLIGLAAAGGVQAQTPAAASATSLPDFTGIVQQNAAAVVHVEAKYNGRRQPRAMPGVPGGDDQAEILRRFFGMPAMPSPEEQKHT